MAKKSDVTSALTRGARGVRRLAKARPGQPGASLFIPGPVEGKRGVTRLMKRDPARGITQPEADKITDVHTDVGVSKVTSILSQNDSASSFGAGRSVIKKAARGPLRRR